MFTKIVTALSILVLSTFSIQAEPAKMNIDCIPQDQAVAYIKQHNLKLMAISKPTPNGVVKMMLKSPSDDMIAIVHVIESQNMACLVDIIKDFEALFNMKLLEKA
jgi:hypothetical protein